MARWATLIEQRRREKSVLLFDTGDFCQIRRTTHQDIKDRLFFEGMKLLGYDAVAIGEREIKFGRKKLHKFAKQYKLSLISSNIIDRMTGKLIAKPFVIKDIGGKRSLFGRKGGLKVGVFSVILPGFVLSVDSKAIDYYNVLDPKIAALEAVTTLRSKGCDLVIAISHQGWKKSLDLAHDVPGIDIVINSHRSHRGTFRERIAHTLVVDIGENKTSFTEIEIAFKGDSLITNATDVGKILLESEDHPELIKLERIYKRETRARGLKSIRKFSNIL